MRETFSPSQGYAIADSANSAIGDCVHMIEDSTLDLAQKTSLLWEDDIVVKYFKEYRDKMYEVVNTLNGNNQHFIAVVESICNNYARIGQMPYVSLHAESFNPVLDVSAVKDHFGNTEDVFGFANIVQGPQLVLDVYEAFDRELNARIESAISAIRNIPAFGNGEISAAIASLLSAVTQALKSSLKSLEKAMIDSVMAAARQYSTVGQQSVETARLTYKGEVIGE